MIPDTVDPDDADRLAIFVEHYRRTNDAVASCQRAGMRDVKYDIRVFAERTLRRPEVQAALRAMAKIEDAVTAPMEVTRESIVGDMEEVYAKALTDGQYASAISAKKLQAFLLGLLETKIAITHGFDVALMSDDQLMRIAEGRMRDITPTDKMKEIEADE